MSLWRVLFLNWEFTWKIRQITLILNKSRQIHELFSLYFADIIMDWMYINPNDSGYSSSDLQLGIYVGDQFRISADAEAKLINILDQLNDEDKVLRCFRRKLGSAQIVEKHLAAIMVESSSADKFDIFSTTIK